MNTKNAIMTTTLSLVAVLAIASITSINNIYAEEESTYKTADGIQPVFTFTFRDGVEIHNFPVFNMDDDFVANSGSPSFSVEGVVGDSPHLHEALDEAFKYKQNQAYQWDYKQFDVDVDFIKNGESMRTLQYRDCIVDNYLVKTLTDDYESYMSSKTGFAIIDDIDFLCAGLNSVNDDSADQTRVFYGSADYGMSSYDFAEDIRTFITFEFDQGMEKVEFPYFELKSGFEESDNNVIPEFSVEGTMSEHPLLDKAINNARKVSGYQRGLNTDFVATIEFTKTVTSETGEISSEVLRTIEYRDCRVSGAVISTLGDKEEGFTGKSGFAYVEDIDFECIGVDTHNTSYDALRGDAPIWKVSHLEHTLPSHEYPLGTGPRAIATFTYADGIEIIDFPIFDQSSILGTRVATGNDGSISTTISSPPTFELEGVLGDFPMLYKRVDQNLSLSSVTGSNSMIELFDVDVELVNGDKVIRGFNYNDCRVTDYVVQSQRDKEESYFKGFALSNTFDFECQGYHPNNPVYDAMFVVEKAKTVSTNDLRNTSTWGPNFSQQ